MNSDQIKGQWKQFEAEAKRTWGELTDDDWKQVEGNIELLAGKIQERYGDAKEVVMKRFDEIFQRIVGKPTGQPADVRPPAPSPSSQRPGKKT
jgi:uncharacterized protein YjbJ (UPF0337 family)